MLFAGRPTRRFQSEVLLFGVHREKSRAPLNLSHQIEAGVVGGNDPGSNCIAIALLVRVANEPNFDPVVVVSFAVVLKHGGAGMKVIDRDIQIAIVVPVEIRGTARVTREVGAALRRSILQTPPFVDVKHVCLSFVYHMVEYYSALFLHGHDFAVDIVVVRTIDDIKVIIAVVVEVENSPSHAQPVVDSPRST